MCRPLSISCYLSFEVIMSIVCAYLFLHTVSAQVGFGGYFGFSQVCQKWGCINRKFNFNDVLPLENQYKDFIKEMFAIEFHDVALRAVDRCYESEHTVKYTNTCPGQALLHCVMDKLIQDCPEPYWKQDDGCATVASLAGNDYMFSQSRYKNLQRNLPLEKRPSMFLHYFRSRCCDLQQMFNESLLSECGITEMLHYFDREPQLRTPAFRNGPSIEDVTTKKTGADVIGQVYNFHLLSEITTSTTSMDYSTNADDDEDGNYEGQDPLDCCEEIARFIRHDWRTDCDFKLKWDQQLRLVVHHDEQVENTRNNEQCEDLTQSASCVLNKMGILNRFGFIDQFTMKNKIRAYSNGKTSYMYAVFNSAFLNVPRYREQCDSPRRLFNLLDAMLVVCDPAKRVSNRQCNKIFTDIRNSVSDITKENLDQIVNNQNQNVQYHVS
ncbi:uncharacterized protein LOC112051723 isoform X2 [Bicyclus anynana]|uniref:Uncharacterized protein LOC112051723 isoform X2 n=1 Tax=Bicyclus anynana TaxID=110368 RepID=A0ABM3LPM2_BICAN|nr:uncharacterized protein LOC112051723 isoform X2 [Bicyclus anynana]